MSASVTLDALATDAVPTHVPPHKGILEIDETAFAKNFNRHPFVIHHHLVGHPLFELPAIIELAKHLPEDSIEYNAGNIPVSQDPALTPRNGLSVEETLRRIEECRSWMVLKHVENHPAYKAVLDACLDEIEVFTRQMQPGMFRREAFLFVSSPGSITPYHMDPEYNFLMHIRGAKRMTVFDGSDRSICSEVELEQYLSGGHRNLVYKDEYETKGMVFDLAPGDGLHIPVTYPHWVKNGDTVSVSLSIAFHTAASERRKLVYTTNDYLRQKGLTPTPYGKSNVLDSAKCFSFRAVRRIRRMLGKEIH